MTILARSGLDVDLPGEPAAGEAQLAGSEPAAPEDEELVIEELVVEELSIDGMCGVY
jgi:mycofactocin precursor